MPVQSIRAFTFNWWASFLASGGYAVLQVNFRGSTGYGYDRFNAGRGGWGVGVMQSDVEDGACLSPGAGLALLHLVSRPQDPSVPERQ